MPDEEILIEEKLPDGTVSKRKIGRGEAEAILRSRTSPQLQNLYAWTVHFLKQSDAWKNKLGHAANDEERQKVTLELFEEAQRQMRDGGPCAVQAAEHLGLNAPGPVPAPAAAENEAPALDLAESSGDEQLRSYFLACARLLKLRGADLLTTDELAAAVVASGRRFIPFARWKAQLYPEA